MKNIIDWLNDILDCIEQGINIHDWAQEDAGAVDAIRGSIYEQRWRGTLIEYVAEHPIAPMVSRAIERLSLLEEPHWPEPVPLDLGLIGIGTYKWKYDTSIIARAFDQGIQFIDTAETYGYGRVEIALGTVTIPLHIVVASKVARNRMAYQSVLNAAQRTLDRLGLPQITVYQIHWPNPTYDLRMTMRAMIDLIDCGSVWAIGLCNVSIDQIQSAQHALLPDHRVSTVQVRYNLVDRGVERALLPYCKEHQIQVIAYSPLGQGFGAILSADKHGVLRDQAMMYEATEAQIALAWLISKGVIPIPRTNKLEHVDEIADAPYIELDPADVNELDEAFPIKE